MPDHFGTLCIKGLTKTSKGLVILFLVMAVDKFCSLLLLLFYLVEMTCYKNCSYSKYRSSHQRCSVREGVLRNFAKLTGKQLCQSLIFNKVAEFRLIMGYFCESSYSQTQRRLKPWWLFWRWILCSVLCWSWNFLSLHYVTYFIRRIFQISTQNVTLQIPFRGNKLRKYTFLWFFKPYWLILLIGGK